MKKVIKTSPQIILEQDGNELMVTIMTKDKDSLTVYLNAKQKDDLARTLAGFILTGKIKAKAKV